MVPKAVVAASVPQTAMGPVSRSLTLGLRPRAVIEAQRASALPVRMGTHTGAAQEWDGTISGWCESGWRMIAIDATRALFAAAIDCGVVARSMSLPKR